MFEGNNNISVTLAKESRMAGTSDHTIMSEVNVGLQFDIVHTNDQNWNSGRVSRRKNEGSTNELEKLHEMHKNGHLSEHEYNAAKSKLLGI